MNQKIASYQLTSSRKVSPMIGFDPQACHAKLAKLINVNYGTSLTICE